MRTNGPPSPRTTTTGTCCPLSASDATSARSRRASRRWSCPLTREVVGIPPSNRRLRSPSGLARAARGRGRKHQENPHPAPRTRLARCPTEVGRVADTPAAARAVSPTRPAPGSAARRNSLGWPPATLPASPHGAAADTRPPSMPAVACRLADQDGTTSGNNSTVDDDAMRACPALIGPAHPLCERDLSFLAAPNSPSHHRRAPRSPLTRPSGPLLASTGGSFLASVEALVPMAPFVPSAVNAPGCPPA